MAGIREEAYLKQVEVDELKSSLKLTQLNDVIAEKEEYHVEVLNFLFHFI